MCPGLRYEIKNRVFNYYFLNVVGSICIVCKTIKMYVHMDCFKAVVNPKWMFPSRRCLFNHEELFLPCNQCLSESVH